MTYCLRYEIRQTRDGRVTWPQCDVYGSLPDMFRMFEGYVADGKSRPGDKDGHIRNARIMSREDTPSEILLVK